jgi:hypothetical protein
VLRSFSHHLPPVSLFSPPHTGLKNLGKATAARLLALFEEAHRHEFKGLTDEALFDAGVVSSAIDRVVQFLCINSKRSLEPRTNHHNLAAVVMNYLHPTTPSAATTIDDIIAGLKEAHPSDKVDALAREMATTAANCGVRLALFDGEYETKTTLLASLVADDFEGVSHRACVGRP